ncbi:hypothetical protein G9A89_020880 [Geosiphon pyriformis]|nr:hypothetical protein G9A89_020880 [Geosiphon pyriformis]
MALVKPVEEKRRTSSCSITAMAIQIEEFHPDEPTFFDTYRRRKWEQRFEKFKSLAGNVVSYQYNVNTWMYFTYCFQFNGM